MHTRSVDSRNIWRCSNASYLSSRTILRLKERESLHCTTKANLHTMRTTSKSLNQSTSVTFSASAANKDSTRSLSSWKFGKANSIVCRNGTVSLSSSKEMPFTPNSKSLRTKIGSHAFCGTMNGLLAKKMLSLLIESSKNRRISSSMITEIDLQLKLI